MKILMVLTSHSHEAYERAASGSPTNSSKSVR
jgi:hypothetical protein